MSSNPRQELQLGASSVVVFTQSFPFGRGEEFLEAELPHLLDAFDSVLVVPTMYSEDMVQTRQLPDRAWVIKAANAHSRQAEVVARFCLQHPLSAVRSICRAFRWRISPAQMIADIKFDLHATAVAHGVGPAVEVFLKRSTNVLFYGYWLHTPTRVAIETRRTLRMPWIPVVSRANGFDLYVERSPQNYLPQRELLFRNVRTVFAASMSAEAYLREQYPAYLEKFTTDRIGTGGALNAGNADQGSFHLVSCSYIAPVKRLEMLIDDLADAQRQLGMPLRWSHIGSGPDEYWRRVRAYAAAQLAPGSFQFLGHMSSVQLREWYARNPATAFVQVSESEGGLAASIQEALAQGLPTIVTTVGGVVVLKDAPGIFDGLLEKDHRPADFTKHVKKLLAADSDEYAGYVASSMSYWHSNCSADVLAASFAQRLRSLLVG